MTFLEEILDGYGINIENAQETETGSLIIDLEDFDAFNQVFSQLSDSNELELCDEETNFNDMNGIVLFEGNNYHISIIADFDGDIYKLVAEED